MKEISNKNAAQQRTGHNSKPHTVKLELPDEISDANCQINGHFRIFGEDGRKRFHVPFLLCAALDRSTDPRCATVQSPEKMNTHRQQAKANFIELAPVGHLRTVDH